MSTSAVSIGTTSSVGFFPAPSAAKERRAYVAATMNQSYGAKSLCIAIAPQLADTVGDVGVGKERAIAENIISVVQPAS